MHHTSWGAKDGLLGDVSAVQQTTDGFLWLGTSAGLYRFDGVTFDRYQPEGEELPAVAVFTLLATRDGGLWVGYSRGGVSFIAADGRVTSYSDTDGVPVGGIRSFAQDHEGTIWLAATGGLARLEGGRWRPVRGDWNYPCRSAWRLLVLDDGTLWVAAASPNKLLFLPKGSRRFQDAGVSLDVIAPLVLVGDELLLADGPTDTVHAVHKRPDGTVTSRVLAHVPSLAIAGDRSGAVWLGGYGVTRLPADSLAASRARAVPAVPRPQEQDLGKRVVTCVFIDREHNVWVATQTGLERYRRRNLSWTAYPQVHDGGGLMIGPAGEALLISSEPPPLLRARDGSLVHHAPEHPFVGIPDRLRPSAAWISARGRLLHWVDGRFEPVAPPDDVVARGYNFNVMDVGMERSGRLWAAVNGLGLFSREQDRWTFVPVLRDRPDWTPVRIHVDSGDRVWLAYRDEVAMLERGAVREFTKADGLDIGPILAIASREGEVWLGGEKGVAFLRGGRFHAVRATQAGELGSSSAIIATGDGVWIGAAPGIVHLPETELRRLREDPRHVPADARLDLTGDLPDPLKLHARYVTGLADADDVLWFVTTVGLARVDPRQIVRNPLPPPVVIRAVNADDVAYAPRGEVSLPPLTRTLRIDHTALSLTNPERVRFRYRLEGWETNWHEAGTRRTVFYTDLKPGRYAFRVLACNNDGVWNETGATLAFTVAPAWFQTTWFQALVVAGAIAAVALLYRMRVRRVSAMLSVRFDERLAERTRLARELHDTLLQTVQGSKMVADDALARSGDAERMRRALERLSEWLGRAVTEGRGVLHSLRVSAVDANDLAEAFRRAADDPTKPAALTVLVEVRGEARDLEPIVRDEIYRIGYEAMRNAFLHARATRLAIEILYAHDLALRIADDGVGIEPEIAASGKRGRFGLPGMRERAVNIGGTLDIDSSSTGTRITLVVPGRRVFRRGGADPAADPSLRRGHPHL